jgi:hypothetical protein
VYPNPVGNEIELDFGQKTDGTGRIEIYDAQGKSVLSETIRWNEGRYTLDIRSLKLAPGMFQMRVVQQKNVLVRSIIKQ